MLRVQNALEEIQAIYPLLMRRVPNGEIDNIFDIIGVYFLGERNRLLKAEKLGGFEICTTCDPG